MRRLRIYVLLIWLFAFSTSCRTAEQGKEVSVAECPSGLEPVKVRKVYDGDTVEFLNGERLRYSAVNTPELRPETGVPEPFAKEAYLKNKELVEGKTLCLERNPKERDRYGRLLGELYFANGTSISEILVREGLGLVCYYEGGAIYYEKHLPFQEEAIRAKRGLFSLLDNAPPGPYFGNKASKRFHHPQCSKNVKIKRLVTFNTLEEALLAGYCPVRTCSEYVFRK